MGLLKVECFECGSSDEIQQHHVVPRSLGGKKTIPLCAKCHGLIHGQNLNVKKLQREGLKKRKSKGLRHGHAPFGYTLAGGKLKEDAFEMEWLHRVKMWREMGWGYKKIAKALNDHGVHTKQKGRWHECTIAWLCKKRKNFPWIT